MRLVMRVRLPSHCLFLLPMLGKEQAPNNDRAEIFIEVHTRSLSLDLLPILV